MAVEHIHKVWESMGKAYDISLVKTDKNRYGHDLRALDVCWRPFMKLVVHPDGLLAACSNALKGFEQNIREVSMLRAWSDPDGWINKFRRDYLNHDLSRYPSCKRCDVRSYEYHPEDILDGHEAEILARMEGKSHG